MQLNKLHGRPGRGLWFASVGFLLILVQSPLQAHGMAQASASQVPNPAPLSRETDAPACNLYYDPMARINNELVAAGLDGDGPLKVEDCLPFDQMHYLGEEAMQEASKVLKAGKGKKLLDIGAGFGGPARYMAHTYGCEVIGMELQKELVTGCTKLSERMAEQLQGRATFRQGSATDAAAYNGLHENIDGIYSMLTILHIPDRHKVWPLALKALKPGSRVYVEDFYMKGPFSPEESKQLENTVGCSMPLPSKEEYIAQLQDAGFCQVELEDVSGQWGPYVAERRALYLKNSDRHVRVQGEPIFESMKEFYETVDTLFKGGRLGGCRVTATRP